MTEPAEGQLEQNGVVFAPKKSILWNSDSREFLGRTWDSWAKITVFYLVFYSCLAAFFAALLVGFFQTIDPKRPTQLEMKSLLKSNPGMGFRPMPNLESTLIHIKQGNEEQTEPYRTNLKTFVEGYLNQTGDNLVNCTEHTDGKELALNGKACQFNAALLGKACTAEAGFGYVEGTPCVALKINRIFDWMPIPFNKSDLDDTNNTMAQQAKATQQTPFDPNYIGVSCEGENDADKDYIGKIDFFPPKGFAVYNYPFVNQDNYKAPIVFARFRNPKEGVLIQVWCRIWINNIRHHKNDKAGSIHFELFVD